jgi:hypothetical protein
MSEFQGKEITDIHTHFPDWKIREKGKKDEEAIEFEFSLSKVKNHIYKKEIRRIEDSKVFHIIYWEENDEKGDIERTIKKLGYPGKVNFICLKDYFNAEVRKNKGEIRCYWTFLEENSSRAEIYSLNKIMKDTIYLYEDKSIEYLHVNRHSYRTIGFSSPDAGYIDYEHWSRIHLFPTTSNIRGNIPGKLFVKPKGFKHFVGYFDIKKAFKIKSIASITRNDKYFSKYYFSELGEGRWSKNYTFLIYSKFTLFKSNKIGSDLYKYLENKGINLKALASCNIRGKYNKQIDKLVK